MDIDVIDRQVQKLTRFFEHLRQNAPELLHPDDRPAGSPDSPDRATVPLDRVRDASAVAPAPRQVTSAEADQQGGDFVRQHAGADPSEDGRTLAELRELMPTLRKLHEAHTASDPEGEATSDPDDDQGARRKRR